jgi:hydroxymethylbilane synthase
VIKKEVPDSGIITIGTRGSALALAQTHWVRQQLLHRFPELEVAVRIIKTSADKDTTTSLRSSPGIGVFVKELEQALLQKEVDIAVHSMKDVPTKLSDGLFISAIPEREDARDALVSSQPADLQELAKGCRIGTGSFRRQSQLLSARPDLQIVDIRGNVETRIRKMEDGYCDAVILACAGLRRLGLQNRISTVIEFSNMLPAPGQGALAIETRIDDFQVNQLVSALNHPPTANAVTAERDFLEHLGGGCNVPIAIFARPENGFLQIDALVSSPDGKQIVRDAICDDSKNSSSAVAILAERMLSHGGAAILKEFRHRG